jgi:hypothetical protein
MYNSSAYLDPTDRPLSAGEIFALFILGLTFLGCLLLAIAIGLTRGESAVQVSGVPSKGAPTQQHLSKPIDLELRQPLDKPLVIINAPPISEFPRADRY